MKILAFIIISLIVFNIVRILYFNWKFKRDSKYPCFVVISQDGFISNPMYYKDAKEYSDKICGYIYTDREEYNRLKSIDKTEKV